MKTEKIIQPQQRGLTVLNDDERRQMIEQAAYLCAESRGFAGGYQEQDWYKAEAIVDRMLNGAEKPVSARVHGRLKGSASNG